MNTNFNKTTAFKYTQDNSGSQILRHVSKSKKLMVFLQIFVIQNALNFEFNYIS
jgi:hypothetical protein